MNNIVFYKIKDSVLNKIRQDYEDYKDLCSLYEFMLYWCGVPEFRIVDYFNENNIKYDHNYEGSYDKGIITFNKIFKRYITNYFNNDTKRKCNNNR